MIRRLDFFLFLFMMQHHAMYVCCVGSTSMIIPAYFGKARARWMCRVFAKWHGWWEVLVEVVILEGKLRKAMIYRYAITICLKSGQLLFFLLLCLFNFPFKCRKHEKKRYPWHRIYRTRDLPAVVGVTRNYNISAYFGKHRVDKTHFEAQYLTLRRSYRSG